MELRQYALVLWRWLWLIVLGMALAAGAAFLISQRTQPVYSASVTLLINQAPNSTATMDYSSILTSERLARTYAELLRTPEVLDAVIKKLALKTTPGQLAGQVQVELVRDTQLINVSVEDTNPVMAANIANTIAQVFKTTNESQQLDRYASLKGSLNTQIQQVERDIAATQAAIDALRAPRSPADESRAAQLQTALAQYRNNYVTLLNNLAQLRLAEAQAVSNVVIAQPARVPTGPVRPRTLMNTMLAAVVGAMVAMGTAFLIEYLDDTIKSPDEIEQLTRSSTLGLIGQIEGETLPQRLVTALAPRSPISEAYRVLRTNIQSGSVDEPVRTLLVTSSNPGEGKSITVANLAVVLAQTGKRVVALDSDLRRPALHKYFGLSNNRGLTTALLNGQHPIEEHLQATAIENLNVLTSGPPPSNPAELLGSRRMAQILQELSQRADVVILDSPPVLVVTDAVLLAQQADATLIVVQPGVTRRGLLMRALDALKSANARVLGVAFNRVLPSRLGYYSYAYQYYYYSRDGQRGHRRSSGLRWPWLRTSRSSQAGQTGPHEMPALPEAPMPVAAAAVTQPPSQAQAVNVRRAAARNEPPSAKVRHMMEAASHSLPDVETGARLPQVQVVGDPAEIERMEQLLFAKEVMIVGDFEIMPVLRTLEGQGATSDGVPAEATQSPPAGLMAESQRAGCAMLRALDRMGFVQTGRDGGTSAIRFSRVTLCGHLATFAVDTEWLYPFSVNDLTRLDVLEQLSAATHKPVKAFTQGGLTYVVELEPRRRPRAFWEYPWNVPSLAEHT